MSTSLAHGHRRAELRNLALHRVALANLRARPELRSLCVALVDRWLTQPEQRPSAPWLERWREMLNAWSLDAIEATVLNDTEGQTLRQCSPLGPALTPRERWAALAAVEKSFG